MKAPVSMYPLPRPAVAVLLALCMQRDAKGWAVEPPGLVRHDSTLNKR